MVGMTYEHLHCIDYAFYGEVLSLQADCKRMNIYGYNIERRGKSNAQSEVVAVLISLEWMHHLFTCFTCSLPVSPDHFNSVYLFY